MQKKNIQDNKMGTMPIGRLVLNMSLPLITSMLFQALYNVVDSIYVARLSQDAMNAVSLAYPTHTLVMALGTGTGVGMNALISRSLGEKNQEKANIAANTGLSVYILLAIVFGLLGVFAAEPFLRFQTANAQIIAYGIPYIQISVGCSFALFFQVSNERVLQATGRTGLAMIPQILGALINICVDPILIFGLFGFPRLEVAGAAIASAIGQFTAGIVGLILNLKKNPDVRLRFRLIRFRPRIAGEIFKIGLPSIVTQSIGSFVTFNLNRILINFTEAATAVLGAYYKIQSFVMLPVFGLNSASVPIISYNYGSRQFDRLKKAIRLALTLATCMATVGAVLFETIPGFMLGLFSPSEEMLAVGIPALRIIGIQFPIAGFCVIAGCVFQSLKKPMFSLINTVCRQVVLLLPAAYLLSLTGNINAVWFCFLVAEAGSLVMCLAFLKKTFCAVLPNGRLRD